MYNTYFQYLSISLLNELKKQKTLCRNDKTIDTMSTNRGIPMRTYMKPPTEVTIIYVGTWECVEITVNRCMPPTKSLRC